jgi:hypothetical protein
MAETTGQKQTEQLEQQRQQTDGSNKTATKCRDVGQQLIRGIIGASNN